MGSRGSVTNGKEAETVHKILPALNSLESSVTLLLSNILGDILNQSDNVRIWHHFLFYELFFLALELSQQQQHAWQQELFISRLALKLHNFNLQLIPIFNICRKAALQGLECVDTAKFVISFQRGRNPKKIISENELPHGNKNSSTHGWMALRSKFKTNFNLLPNLHLQGKSGLTLIHTLNVEIWLLGPQRLCS